MKYAIELLELWANSSCHLMVIWPVNFFEIDIKLTISNRSQSQVHWLQF
jgi:hypothetical protein